MGFVVDWSNQSFPRIREAPEGTAGDPIETVMMLVFRHHLASAIGHLDAMAGILDDVAN